MVEQGGIPDLFTEPQAGKVAFTVRDIGVDEIEVWELDGLEATFEEGVAVLVVGPWVCVADFWNEGVKDVLGLDFGEDGGSGIARTLGAVPNFEIVGQVNLGLALFGFRFLKTDDVGLLGIHEIEESSFLQSGAQAIDVPGIDFDMLFGGVCAGGGAGWI